MEFKKNDKVVSLITNNEGLLEGKVYVIGDVNPVYATLGGVGMGIKIGINYSKIKESVILKGIPNKSFNTDLFVSVYELRKDKVKRLIDEIR